MGKYELLVLSIQRLNRLNMEIFKLLLAPFFTVTSYSELLRKLAWFVFWEVYAATWFLREIPDVQVAFLEVEKLEPIQKALLATGLDSVNATGFAIALLLAGITMILQLHDRVSDLLGIRRRFDVRDILLPMSVLLGVRLVPAALQKLESSRDSLMQQVFYKYASSRADNPVVDKHYIEHALTAWSWYWVTVEGMVLWIVCAAISLYFAAYGQASAYCLLFLSYWIGGCFLYRRCERNVRPEVEAIVSHPEARTEVIGVLSAL